MLLHLASAVIVCTVVATLLAVALLLATELWRTRTPTRVLRGGRRFDLATFFGVIAAVGIACATREHFGWPTALLGGFIVSWLVHLFATELLAGTKYGADRSRTREYRRRNEHLAADEPKLVAERVRVRRRKIRLTLPGLYFVFKR